MRPKHPVRVLDYTGTMEQLAEDLGDLRYDTLAHIMTHLSDKLARDAAADSARGRAQLAASLERASALVADVANEIDRTWKICLPHEQL